MSIVEEIIKARTPKPRVPVLKVFGQRFSPRVFNDMIIPEEHIQSILEAARWAPSARNHQPWFFYCIEKAPSTAKKLSLCIPERNGWALMAPLIIIACFNPNDPSNAQNKWAQYDLGAAVVSLILQAQELGYFSRQIGSFDPAEIKKQFSIAEPFMPFTLIAMGKIGNEIDYETTDKRYVEKDLITTERKDVVYQKIIR